MRIGWLAATLVVLAACSERPERAASPGGDTRGLGDALIVDPLAGDAQVALQQYFPQERQAALAATEEAVASGAAMSEVGVRFWTTLEALMLKHAPLIQKAPTESLMADIRARESFLLALQRESIDKCARFSDSSDVDLARLSEASYAAFWKSRSSYYNAIGLARKEPVARAPVSQEALSRFADELQRRRKAARSAAANEREAACQEGIEYYRALQAAAPDDAGTIFAAEYMKKYEQLR
jgi:hypothetical protein